MPEQIVDKDNGEPLIPPRVWLVFQYGLLVILVGWLAFSVVLIWKLPNRDPYAGIGTTAWLLFLHIAYNFRWSQRVSLTLKTLAWSLAVLSFYFSFR